MCVYNSVPYQVQVNSVSAKQTALTLSCGVSRDSVVTGYKVSWKSNQCPDNVDEGYLFRNCSTYSISGLREGTRYNVTVSAVNMAGASQPIVITAKTEENS